MTEPILLEGDNVKSNVDTTKNLTPFTRDRQPTPEQKKAGWVRKKQAQEMMDKIREYMKLSVEDFKKKLEDIKNNPDKYTVQDSLLAKYAIKAFNGEKFMLDWFDRNISKAPQELSGADGEKLNTVITIIDASSKH